MPENAQNPAAQNANENPGEPTEAARNPQTGDIQKDWNSGHPGGVATTIEDPSNSSSSPETPGNPNTETEPGYGNGNGALSPVRLDFPVVPPDLKDLRPTDGSAPGNERAKYRHVDLAKVYGNE